LGSRVKQRPVINSNAMVLQLLILATLCVGSHAGTVLVTSHVWEGYGGSDTIIAFDAKTGHRMWSRAFGSDDYSYYGYLLTMGADGRTAFVSNCRAWSSTIFALDVQTSQILWSHHVGGEGTAPLLSNDGSTIYVSVTGTNHAYLQALDSATGKSKWTIKEIPEVVPRGIQPMPAGGYFPAISPDDATVFWTTQTKHLYAVKTSSGTFRWHTGQMGSIPNLPTASPDGSRVFVGGGSHGLQAWWSNGTMAWTAPSVGEVMAKPAVTSDSKTVFAGDYSNYVTAFKASTGSKLWQSHIDRYFHAGKRLLVSSDETTLFVPARNFLALAVSDGSLLWQLNPGDGSESTGTFCLGDGLVFVTFEKNEGDRGEAHALYAVDPKTGTVVWRRTDLHRSALGPGSAIAWSPIDVLSTQAFETVFT